MSVKIGDIVTYEVFGGESRTVKVTEVSEDIKNGKSGFSGTVDGGMSYWGYDYQIIAIECPSCFAELAPENDHNSNTCLACCGACGELFLTAGLVPAMNQGFAEYTHPNCSESL